MTPATLSHATPALIRQSAIWQATHVALPRPVSPHIQPSPPLRTLNHSQSADRSGPTRLHFQRHSQTQAPPVAANGLFSDTTPRNQPTRFAYSGALHMRRCDRAPARPPPMRQSPKQPQPPPSIYGSIKPPWVRPAITLPHALDRIVFHLHGTYALIRPPITLKLGMNCTKVNRWAQAGSPRRRKWRKPAIHGRIPPQITAEIWPCSRIWNRSRRWSAQIVADIFGGADMAQHCKFGLIVRTIGATRGKAARGAPLGLDCSPT